jgi:hypothetical protein
MNSSTPQTLNSIPQAFFAFFKGSAWISCSLLSKNSSQIIDFEAFFPFFHFIFTLLTQDTSSNLPKIY